MLGEAERPSAAAAPRTQPKAGFDDWLAVNGLTRDLVRAQLAAITAPDGSVGPPVPARLGLSAAQAWGLCAGALRAAVPELGTQIGEVEMRAPKCLAPRAGKHPRPFTYDLGGGALPLVSLHYQDRPVDLLAMAHEVGHALQIVASQGRSDGQMPPVARECCAFLAELAILQHLPTRFAALAPAHQADDAIYFGDNARALAEAMTDPRQPYRYAWNYPLARHIAARLFRSESACNLGALYRAGPEGGSYIQHCAAAWHPRGAAA